MDNLLYSGERFKALFSKAKTIAVIGLSDKPDATSFQVAEVMQSHGYKIIPIHPKADVILGEKVHRRVDEIPFAVDIVNIFRRPEFIPDHAEEILKMNQKPQCVWLQLGISHPASAARLAEAGMWVVEDRCIKVEYSRFMR